MESEEIKIHHSRRGIISYSFAGFIWEFLVMAFSAYSYFYYETEIGLNSLLCGLAFVIYAVWNAVNDPLLGYLTDRPFKFTKKWGRRFPWLVFGGFPWIISYILIFTPPDVDPQDGAWIIFAWFTITICLYDTLATLFMVNYDSLFPDKFRSDEERRLVTGTRVPIAVFGTVLGAVLPPFFIEFGNKQSYLIQAGVVFLICLIALFITLPGTREDQVRIDCYLESCEEIEKTSFFKEFRTALKQKNFVAYIILYFCYMVLVRSMTSSIAYTVRYILKMEADAIALIMLAFLVGVLISIPIWYKLANRINDNRKVILISGVLVGLLVSPLIILEDYTLIIIVLFIWGLAEGGFWLMLSPVFADTIDESVAETSERREGLYNGFLAFFARFAIAAQAISFSVTHTLTGFVEGADTQSDLAVWGIHIHLALIPMIFMLTGVFLFWKFYDLTPERVQEVKLKLKQLKL